MKELYDNNPETALQALAEFCQTDSKYKSAWAKLAKKCVNYANGDLGSGDGSGSRLIVNDQYVNTKSRSKVAGYKSNEIAPIIRTLQSFLTRSEPSVKIISSGRDSIAKNITSVAKAIHEAKYDLDGEYEISSKVCFWALATGSAFTKDYWDLGLGDYVQQVDPETGELIIDPATGEPVMSQQKSGMNNTAVLTALNTHFDNSITDFKNLDFIGDSYLMPIEWAKEAFDSNAPGYTGKIGGITETNSLADTLMVFEELKLSIPFLSRGTGRFDNKGKCLVREWYIKPNRQWKNGRLIIEAGGVCVYDSGQAIGSPYIMSLEPQVWHPYNYYFYEHYIGRMLGKGLVEQLLHLQTRLDEINLAILQNANTLAKPNVIIANGQVAQGMLNGQGSNTYKYNHLPNVPPPQVMQGTPLPTQFFNEKQMIIEQMIRIAGTNLVMSGQPPSGVSAASAIAQLLENSNSQFSDPVKRLEKFNERRYTFKLRLLHKFNVYPDNTINDRLKMLTRDNTEVEINDFVGAEDLSDNIFIKIEPGSMIPRSETAKSETYKELANSQLFGSMFAEPSPKGDKLREQLMTKLGLDPLETDEGIELKKAKWENDRIRQSLPVTVSEFDVSAVHLPCHKSHFQNPDFIERASPEEYNALYQHIKEHEAVEEQKAMQAQAEAIQAQGMAQEQDLPAGRGIVPVQ